MVGRPETNGEARDVCGRAAEPHGALAEEENTFAGGWQGYSSPLGSQNIITTQSFQVLLGAKNSVSGCGSCGSLFMVPFLGEGRRTFWGASIEKQAHMHALICSETQLVVCMDMSSKNCVTPQSLVQEFHFLLSAMEEGGSSLPLALHELENAIDDDKGGD